VNWQFYFLFYTLGFPSRRCLLTLKYRRNFIITPETICKLFAILRSFLFFPPAHNQHSSSRGESMEKCTHNCLKNIKISKNIFPVFSLFKTVIPKRYVYLRLALNLNIASFMLSNFKKSTKTIMRCY